VGYSLSYNESHEQANWVSYIHERSKASASIERGNDFRTDPSVKTGSAELDDYAGSGYDRGHLAPAADMAWSARAMSESFFMSNMSPQLPSFNRGIWKQLESLVRSWAMLYDSLLIVTGPVLTDGLTTIGFNRVSVPEQYYKLVYRLVEGDFESIAFVLNQRANGDLSEYVKSVSEVEELVGIDFCHGLGSAQLKETRVCQNCWEWKPSDGMKSGSEDESQPNRCKAITKSGTRCKNSAGGNPTGLCGVHRK
jgi:endonuclease G